MPAAGTLAARGAAATRQLAKRQLTWLRSNDVVERFDCLRPVLAGAVTTTGRSDGVANPIHVVQPAKSTSNSHSDSASLTVHGIASAGDIFRWVQASDSTNAKTIGACALTRSLKSFVPAAMPVT